MKLVSIFVEKVNVNNVDKPVDNFNGGLK